MTAPPEPSDPERRPPHAGARSTSRGRAGTRPTRGLSLRLVSYNIHKGIGGIDRLYRPARIIEVLQQCGGDIVFLQEVDEGVPRSRRDRQVDLIGDALEMPYRCYAPNVALRTGHYGNAVLSRWPIDRWENIELTIPLKKRRGALHARVTVKDDRRQARLWLFNAHLGLSGLERRAQVRRLLAWLRRHHPPHDAGIVVGGDLNDVFNQIGPRLLRPAGFEGPKRPHLTFPASAPVRALDKIFVRGALSIEGAHRSRMKLAQQASDHLPIVFDLRAGA